MSNIIDLRKIKKEGRVTSSNGVEIREEITAESLEILEVEKIEEPKAEERIKQSKEEVEFIQPSQEERAGFWSQALEFSLELIKVVVISLAIVIPVRYFLIQPFYVKGASMEPSFFDHEYLIINEIVYRVEEPKRGDIVVFKYPRQPNQYFIKRVIGLPGEQVSIKDGKVIIYNKKYSDGKVLNESSYLSRGLETSGEIDIKLKSDEFFVLGDNRDSSLDSRTFGPVPRKNIIGRTWFRGWPFNRITKFETPEYNL